MSLHNDDIRPTSSIAARNGQRYELNLIRKIFSGTAGYRWNILFVLVLSALAAPLSLLAPLPVKLAIDCVLGGEELPAFVRFFMPEGWVSSNQAMLTFAAFLLVFIACIQYVRGLSESVLATYTSERLVQRFRSQLLDHVQRLSLRYHDSQGTSASLYRIQYDALAFDGVILQGLIPISTAVFTLFAMIYVTARIDRSLTFIALAVGPILFLITVLFRRRLRTKWTSVKELESSVLSVVQEVLSSLRVVKAFGRETWEVERFRRRVDRSIHAKMSAVFSEGLFSLLIGVTVAAGTAAVLYVGVKHVQAGSLTLGDLVLVMLYLAMLYQPMETIGVKFAGLQSALVSADRAFTLLATMPDVTEKISAVPLRKSRGAIEFRGVSFAYDQNHSILENISFNVQPGTRVGIAGTTGAGKTTLVNLLPRFYDPTQGRVLLDGLDLREYNLADLRRQFSIVLQDTVLFSTSIAENIAYGRAEASEDDIIAAAKAAHAHEFIKRQPDGYATQVGERGMRLSGGERQRIGLARAFLRNAPILILDEPTSSVDVKTESLVMDALEHLMQARTTFVISHRPNTLNTCDLLLRVEQGHLQNATLLAP